MATHHVRHPSHSKRPLPANARPSKPALLTKRSQSYNSKHSPKTAHYKETDSEDEEESMAVSFLNYCTVCEKQIIVPSNSVLYCSESCRKRDTEKPLSYTYDHYSPPTTPFSTFSFEDLHFRDIVPQRHPTQPESKRSSCAFSDTSSTSSAASTPPDHSAADIKRYLRQHSHSHSYSDATTRAGRPRFARPHHTSHSYSAAPSLCHTPALTPSFPTTSTTVPNTTVLAPYSPPSTIPAPPSYPPSPTRPLPPRTKPTTSSFGAKSIDLVTPLTAPSSPHAYSYKAAAVARTEREVVGGEMAWSYGKSAVLGGGGGGGSRGGLGRLLMGEGGEGGR